MTLMKLRSAKGTTLIKNSTIAAGVFFLSSVFSGTVHAIHKGAGDLVCGACHTMHNSQGDTSLGGNAGGSLILLRGAVATRAEIHKLCLQCHGSNGAQASTLHVPQNVMAPKVYSSATWTSDDPFNKIGSGGNFSPELNAGWNVTTASYLGKGHSLGATNVTPPGGDAQIDNFSCTNCHDPHGTSSPANSDINIFRNLRASATGASNNSNIQFMNDPAKPWFQHKSYVGGVNGTYFGGSETDNGGSVIWPVYRGALTGVVATDAPNSNSYATAGGNSSFEGPTVEISGTMSRWCAQCHDDWHEVLSPSNKVIDVGQYTTNDYRTWRRHGTALNMPRLAKPGCATGCHKSALDRSNYSLSLIQAGKGLPVTSNRYDGNSLTDVYYQPTTTEVNPMGLITQAEMFGEGPEVFCLSCHFAHGGPYNDNLRWDYTFEVATGSQTPNGVPSNKGCQLCHNRGG